MNKVSEYFLPPNVYRRKNNAEAEESKSKSESEQAPEPEEVKGYLEIEVSRIHFITVRKFNNTKSKLANKKSLDKFYKYSKNYKTKQNKQKQQQQQQGDEEETEEEEERKQEKLTSGITAKIIWWGEQRENAASVSISCEKVKNNKNKITNKCNNKYNECNNYKNKQQINQQQQHLAANSNCCCQHKHNLRYVVRNNLELFLDYLRDCPRIEIVATTNKKTTTTTNNTASFSSASSSVTSITQQQQQQQQLLQFGQSELPLPALLLRKNADNYINGCNFVYKTKIYALYRNIESGAATCQVQQQQQLKTGEIRLRFKMLFAATATATAAATAASTLPCSAPTTPIKLSTAALQQKQQQKQQQQQQHQKQRQLTAKNKMAMAAAVNWSNATNNNNNHNNNAIYQQHHQQQQKAQTKLQQKEKLLQQQQQKQENMQQKQQYQEREVKTSTTLNTVRPAGKSAEIMDAMKKLDANLAALLAADIECAANVKSNLNLQRQQSPLDDLVVADETVLEHDMFPRCDIAQFERVTAIRLQLEALTLHPEGTQRMELLKSEIRPIFTVECQLSNDLIATVPRYDMFHIMQFESEKFQSLTQCTRFGQQEQRAINLPLQDVADKAKLDEYERKEVSLGLIYFTVWWREPGTCLNEMLGMGKLELGELYAAGLLEKCKCITINRRGQPLASLYLKISLLAEADDAAAKAKLTPDSLISVAGEDEQKIKSSANKTNEKNTHNNINELNNANNNNNSNSNNAIEQQRNKAANPPSESNNNPELLVTNFAIETNKVRLLKGFIYANETRQLKWDANANANATTTTTAATATSTHISLVCQPFWQQQRIVIAAGANNAFNYQEQFSIINDEKFLKSVDKQQLLLEIQPLNGIVRLPLHQFFIAYRDANITNHLCKSKLPVISIDCWAPIVERASGANLGELKCLLAIGSDAQIAHLKSTRGFGSNPIASMPKSPAHQTTTCSNQSPQRSTNELLDLLQSALNAPMPASTAPAIAMPLKPHQANKLQTFKFALSIVGAADLPLNPGATGKGKKSSKRAAANKRFAPNEPPSTYVTFQADDCNAKTYKSHEGMVYATRIIEKSTQPQWQCKLRVTASVEYLTNPQKLFILKLWKKAATDTPQTRLQPTPLEDAIIGFAALNLNLQPTGLHAGGWYNVVDFNGRITGGLEVYIHPLEDLHKLVQQPSTSSVMATTTAAAASASSAGATTSSAVAVATGGAGGNVDTAIDNFEQSLDLTHLNLGQAIKRKFNELEQISQHLRTRLVNVTGQPFVGDFDVAALENWQPLNLDIKTDADDAEDDDFERDLQTPPQSPASNTETQLEEDKNINDDKPKNE